MTSEQKKALQEFAKKAVELDTAQKRCKTLTKSMEQITKLATNVTPFVLPVIVKTGDAHVTINELPGGKIAYTISRTLL